VNGAADTVLDRAAEGAFVADVATVGTLTTIAVAAATSATPAASRLLLLLLFCTGTPSGSPVQPTQFVVADPAGGHASERRQRWRQLG